MTEDEYNDAKADSETKSNDLQSRLDILEKNIEVYSRYVEASEPEETPESDEPEEETPNEEEEPIGDDTMEAYPEESEGPAEGSSDELDGWTEEAEDSDQAAEEDDASQDLDQTRDEDYEADDETVDDDQGVGYIQSGIWETNGAWNEDAGFPGSTEIKADGDTLEVWLYQRCMGLTLPADYDGSDPGARAVFIYVNAVNATSSTVMCAILQWLAVAFNPTTDGFCIQIDNKRLNIPIKSFI